MGRTRWPSCGPSALTDHPHARGENRLKRFFAPSADGPSPRAWGERPPRAGPRGADRTIPTRVGRTRSGFLRVPSCTDHPHARGENAFRVPQSPKLHGPSPRAWGERPFGVWGRSTARTIPTRVGRTRPRGCVARVSPDHPHARGENRGARIKRSPQNGPSPRAWGELGAQPLDYLQPRTIPTRVGRTALWEG